MIVSRQNQKIKDIRRLRRCKDDRAVLEGPHLVGEALVAGLMPQLLLATPEFQSSEEGEALLSKSPFRATEIAPEIMDYVADTDSPRGVLAVVSLPRPQLELLPLVKKPLYVFVDGLQDPGNLGALVRVAEAFGADAILLTPGTVHPNHPRALRASAGSLLRAPVFVDVSASALFDRLAPVSPEWVVLTPHGGLGLGRVEVDNGLVLAVGAEGPGLSAEVLNLPHTPVTIPLGGELESLNSTVSTAIALYALGSPRKPD